MTRSQLSFAWGAERLEEAAAAIGIGEDPEGVHDLRVTCRRLRVGLELSGLRPLEDDLARLVRGFGLNRDLDVLLSTPRLPRGLRRWARGAHARAREEALPLIEDTRFRGLVRALRVLPDPARSEVEEHLPRAERRVMKAAGRYERGLAASPLPSAAVGLAILHELPLLTRGHALRRELRKLRYAREWAGMKTRVLVEAQEGFGRLSDDLLLMRCALAWEQEGGALPKRFEGTIRRRVRLNVGAAADHWREVQGALSIRDGA